MDFLVACIFLAASAGVVLDEPDLVWTFEAKSTLYASPLTADMHPAAGLETVISDSEARRLVCVDARGARLWSYEGAWTKRLTSGAALSTTARPGTATLAVAGSDGTLVSLDAASGQELWRRDVGPVTWTGVTWAGLDGDAEDELVVATDDDGIWAFSAGGDVLWKYPPDGSPEQLVLRGPVAVTDVHSDGTPEIFAMDQWGPLCLHGDGTVKWDRVLGMDFAGAPTIADADADGKPEVYATSRDTNGIYAFAADTGDILWRANLIGGADTSSGASIAVGDLDADGIAEIVTGDASGYVYCVESTGQTRWIYPTLKRTHCASTLGDVDGDGAVEVLAVSGDHNLYCISRDGRLKWKYAAGLRLMYPATVADVDQDGLTDILFGGSDGTLRCLTLRGRYNSALTPWPMFRFNTARSASSFQNEGDAGPVVARKAGLLLNGGFELPQRPQDGRDVPEIEMYRAYWPRGWNIESYTSGVWRLDRQTKFDGEYALKVFPREKAITVTSDWMALEPGLATVDAGVIIQGGNLASLRWFGLDGLLREDALKPLAARSVGDEVLWYQFGLYDVAPPPGARWLALTLVSEPKGGPTWWDEADVTARYDDVREADVLVNQVGYDAGAPKRFVVQANFVASDAGYQVVNDAGSVIHEGRLRHEGRIVGEYASDWGSEYYTGDFSKLDDVGRYRIVAVLDYARPVSHPFQIGQNLLWNETARLAFEFFYYQRCGDTVPGFHEACHLDDAASADGQRQYELWGGWHDAGDYNTYTNAPYVYGLARAYSLVKTVFDKDDRDGNGVADFFDEILWGGEHTQRMIASDGSRRGDITSGYGFWGPPALETDNLPWTGDERRIRGADTGNDSSMDTAAMARIARFVVDKEQWVEAAERGLQWAAAQQTQGAMQFSAALDLFAITPTKKYAELAAACLPAPSSQTADLLEQYDSLLGTDHKAAIRDALVKEADALLAKVGNPFGLYPYSAGERVNFFGTPLQGGGWHVGNSSHVLEAAAVAAQAYRYTGDGRYLTFVYDQLNWILGVNPFGVCLMEGRGTVNLPTYHHRYTFAGVPRGAVPGGIPNGVTWRGGSDDRPYLDLSGVDIPDFEPNEVWLPHNTNYLLALAHLYRDRLEGAEASDE